jgi:hypothetical protein
MHRYQALLNRKTQMKIGEEGHKIQSKKMFSPQQD